MCLSFERNVETDNELRVSGGRVFQSLGAMTENALLSGDVWTYGMDGTDESDDLVESEWEGKRETIIGLYCKDRYVAEFEVSSVATILGPPQTTCLGPWPKGYGDYFFLAGPKRASSAPRAPAIAPRGACGALVIRHCLKCSVCNKTQFVIDALFHWKPMLFFEY